MTAVTSHSIVVVIDGELTLTPISASLTFDESWSPFIQASLVCPITNTALLEALDPRTEHTVTITIRQEFGRLDRLRDISRRFLTGVGLAGLSAAFAGKTIGDISRALFWHWTTPGAPYEAPGYRYVTLTLRSRDINHEAGTVTLTAASKEALLTDNAHLATNPYFVTASTVYEAVDYVLSRVGGSVNISSGATSAPFDSAKNPWNPGVTAWEWVAPIVQAAGLRLWSGVTGLWYLSDHQISPPGPDLALTSTGPERSIKRAIDRISRDAEFYTAVIVTYEWTDDAGAQQKAYDLARLPESITGTNQRVYTTTYDRPYPGPGAAKRILTSLLGRGRVIGVTAVSDYSAEPGRPVTVALPSTPLQAGVVSAVSWRFPDDDMDVRMRNAVDAGPIETEYTPIPEEES